MHNNKNNTFKRALATAIIQAFKSRGSINNFSPYIQTPDFTNTNLVPEIVSFRKEDGNPYVKVFLAVEKETYFIRMNVNTKSEFTVESAWIEPLVEVKLFVGSSKLTFEEIIDMSDVVPSSAISDEEENDLGLKEDVWTVLFSSNEGPGTLDEKLDDFLNVLEKDKVGITKLVKITRSDTVLISIDQHIENGEDNFFITKDRLKRLTDLGLGIEFLINNSSNKVLPKMIGI